jgi:hypothetical protein
MNKEIAERTEKVAKKSYPDEKWIDASLVEFENKGKGIGIPSDIKGVKIAESRLTGEKNDERALSREIKQAKILADKGDSIYLLPKAKDANGKETSGPDAILNGIPYELKTVEGSIKKVERRFRESREQCENVYLRVTDKQITKEEVVSKIHGVLNDPTYTGEAKGWLLVHFDGTNETYKYYIGRLK